MSKRVQKYEAGTLMVWLKGGGVWCADVDRLRVRSTKNGWEFDWDSDAGEQGEFLNAAAVAWQWIPKHPADKSFDIVPDWTALDQEDDL